MDNPEKQWFYIYVTAIATMNQITNSWIFLIMISMFLPASAIMYASGARTTTDDNNAASSGGSTDNSGSSTGGSTDNSATLPTTSTASNNTGNAADFVNTILGIHNRERAAVGVPPLTWSNTLAAGAQTWAENVLATGKMEHSTCCGAFRDYGENIAAWGPPGAKTQAGLAQTWADEKKDYVPCNPCNYSGTGHYTQMVWKSTTEVGCGFASGPGGPAGQSGSDVLVCRYTPPGNWNNQPPY